MVLSCCALGAVRKLSVSVSVSGRRRDIGLCFSWCRVPGAGRWALVLTLVLVLVVALVLVLVLVVVLVLGAGAGAGAGRWIPAKLIVGRAEPGGIAAVFWWCSCLTALAQRVV